VEPLPETKEWMLKRFEEKKIENPEKYDYTIGSQQYSDCMRDIAAEFSLKYKKLKKEKYDKKVLHKIFTENPGKKLEALKSEKKIPENLLIYIDEDEDEPSPLTKKQRTSSGESHETDISITEIDNN